MTPGKELLFCALGGSGEIGMNVNLYGCDGKWLMVDLGMTFSGNEYPGVDLVFADLDFIERERDNLIGVVLTHAHEDHIGAVPYFAEDLGVPLYATPFTARLVRSKLDEAGIAKRVKLNIIDHLDRFELGPFGIRYVPLAHSIAEGNALLIDTPYGKIFHTGDWKLDDEPQIGVPATAAELTTIGDDGVLALVCDSTNVFNPEASGSEGEVLRGLLAEVEKHAGKRVLVTTFASNVARLQTLAAVAEATGRRLCVTGRSLDRIITAAQASGYLKGFPQTVDPDTAMNLPRGDVLIVATGGQGEPRAALARIADGHHDIELERGDVVLFSSRQIPGNEIAIGRIQNKLAGDGITIVTDRQSPIHVSGHPGRPELLELYSWIRPQILVPVHGEVRHMGEQARLGKQAGIPKQVFQKNGDLVRLARQVRRGPLRSPAAGRRHHRPGRRAGHCHAAAHGDQRGRHGRARRARQSGGGRVGAAAGRGLHRFLPRGGRGCDQGGECAEGPGTAGPQCGDRSRQAGRAPRCDPLVRQETASAGHVAGRITDDALDLDPRDLLPVLGAVGVSGAAVRHSNG